MKLNTISRGCKINIKTDFLAYVRCLCLDEQDFIKTIKELNVLVEHEKKRTIYIPPDFLLGGTESEKTKAKQKAFSAYEMAKPRQ